MFLNNNNSQNNISNSRRSSSKKDSISILSPTNMMNTLSLHSDDACSNYNNNLIEAINNTTSNNSDNNNSDNISTNKLSLADVTVTEILETYKHDTDLLKHILAAKTEEDKRRSAEEIRRAEEARLQSKFIDLQLDQNRRASLLDNTLGLPTSDWLSQVNNSHLLSPPFLNNTPPSPSHLQPLSPYTLFDVPFAELNISAPSSPEPNKQPSILVEKISLTDDGPVPGLQQQNEKTSYDFPHPPPPTPNSPTQKDRQSIKRTFSRTRSTRKPSVRVLTKKNRYLQRTSSNSSSVTPKQESKKEEEEELPQKQEEEPVEEVKDEETPLDHDKVMEALRAKLKRSSQQLKEQKNTKEEITSMSPSGILLLDLKNPKKSFPLRARATPRASVVRKPNSFISAHKPTTKDTK